MSLQTSLERIDQVIQEFNPFESNFVVKTHQIWDDDFFDVPSLNAHASDAVLEAVRKINAGYIESNTVGFRILAPKGTGKTHILTRIRRTLQEENSGFFIYICEYGKLSRIRFQFLQSLASSLKYENQRGVMRWQELAAALVNRVMTRTMSTEQLIQKFPRALKRTPDLLDQLTASILKTCPDVDNPYIVRAILWTLSTTYAPYAINWLAGRELTESQSKKMDLPESSEEDKEAEAFNTARQILTLISYHTTPVICFDQLDGAEIDDDEESIWGGYTRSQTIGSLAMDIYNNLKRGTLVFTTYAQTWNKELRAAHYANALEDRISNQLELRPMKPDDVVTFVSLQLQEFYTQHGLTPPHPVYPFDENTLRQIGDERPPIREVLQWCFKNFVPGKIIDPTKEIDKLFNSYKASVSDFEDDNDRIAGAIAFGTKYLIGETIEGVTVQEIDREVSPRSRHHGRIQFRVLGEENGNPVKIGVCVLQNSHGRTVGATLKYLTWYDQFNLTRGCLIRTKSIPSHWQVANRHKMILLEELGGEWISFKDESIRDESIKTLIALRKMHQELEDKNLSEADFERFISEKRIIVDNPLLREILSDPAGHSPSKVIDDDEEFEKLEVIPGDDIETTEEDKLEIRESVATS
jgi:hypothetical protein